MSYQEKKAAGGQTMVLVCRSCSSSSSWPPCTKTGRCHSASCFYIRGSSGSLQQAIAAQGHCGHSARRCPTSTAANPDDLVRIYFGLRSLWRGPFSFRQDCKGDPPILPDREPNCLAGLESDLARMVFRLKQRLRTTFSGKI